mgnify:CR=1 FL=1
MSYLTLGDEPAAETSWLHYFNQATAAAQKIAPSVVTAVNLATGRPMVVAQPTVQNTTAKTGATVAKTAGIGLGTIALIVGAVYFLPKLFKGGRR